VKTQYYTAASLDGFIATTDDSLEWLFPLGDVEATSYPAFIRDVGALAMGSVTYEWMLKHLVVPEWRRQVERTSGSSVGRARRPVLRSRPAR
jgi:dihydrofolate reductase